jgi:hypothetical protein
MMACHRGIDKTAVCGMKGNVLTGENLYGASHSERADRYDMNG